MVISRQVTVTHNIMIIDYLVEPAYIRCAVCRGYVVSPGTVTTSTWISGVALEGENIDCESLECMAQLATKHEVLGSIIISRIQQCVEQLSLHFGIKIVASSHRKWALGANAIIHSAIAGRT